jgi:sulfonate transport system permease protein
MWASTGRLAQAFAFPLVLLTVFEAWFRLSGRISDTLAPPSTWPVEFVASLMDGTLAHATGETFAAMLSGLAIGTGLGLVCGIATGMSRIADDTSHLAIEMLRPIPSVALLPLALMIFGFGYKMEIFVVAFATFWPFLILSHSAVAQVERGLLEVARAMGLSAFDTAWKIVLPAAAPRLLTAFRLAAGIALVVAITCEIAANPQGLGHALMLSQETLRPSRMFVFLIWIGLLGLLMNTLLLRIERHLFAHRGDFDASVSS